MEDSTKHPFGTAITTVTEDKLMLDIPTESENPVVAEAEKLPQTVKTDSVNNCTKGSGKGEKENITVTKSQSENFQNIMADKLHQVQPMSNRTNRSGSGVRQNAQEMKPFNQRVYQIKTEKLEKSPEKFTNSEVRVIYNHYNPDTDSSDDDDSGDCTIIQVHLDEEDNENDNLVSCNNGKKEELSGIRNEAKKNSSSTFVSNSKTADNLVPIQTFTEKVSAWMQHNNYREPSSDISVSSDDNNFIPSSPFYFYMEDEDADDKDECIVLRDGCSEDEVAILYSSSTDTQSESSSSGCSTSSSHEESESDSDDCCILLENEILDGDKDELNDTVPVPVPVAQANIEVEVVNSNSAINEDDATKTIITSDNAEDEIIFIKELQCPRKVGSLLNLKWNRPVPITVLNYRRRQMLLKSVADEALKSAALASAREASKRKFSGVNDTTSVPTKLRCDILPSEDSGNYCGFTKEASVYLRPAKLSRVSFSSTM